MQSYLILSRRALPLQVVHRGRQYTHFRFVFQCQAHRDPFELVTAIVEGFWFSATISRAQVDSMPSRDLMKAMCMSAQLPVLTCIVAPPERLAEGEGYAHDARVEGL